jgi:macrolide transport system ATP-binding/permease protein
MEISMQLRSNYIRDIELLVVAHPQNLEGTIRATLGSIAPDLTVLSIIPFSEQLERNFNQERLIARLTTLFGLLALFLACIGIYGVLAYSVVRRTNEIGIRMALGAKRWQILRLMLREAATLALLGVAIGVPAALVAGRFLSSLLYDLKPWDPMTLVSSAGILLAVAGVAAFWPAFRASRVDPTVALRYD